MVSCRVLASIPHTNASKLARWSGQPSTAPTVLPLRSSLVPLISPAWQHSDDVPTVNACMKRRTSPCRRRRAFCHVRRPGQPSPPGRAFHVRSTASSRGPLLRYFLTAKSEQVRREDCRAGVPTRTAALESALQANGGEGSLRGR
jgi:hypothetical protein